MQPVHYMRTARIDIPVSVLILDMVVDILLVLEEISQIWQCIVHSLPHLQIDPLKRLVGLSTIGVEVLIHTVVL